MEPRIKNLLVRSIFQCILALVYFVLYPDDLVVLLNPLEKLLGISHYISPGMYGVIGAGIISWTILRVWGQKSKSTINSSNH